MKTLRIFTVVSFVLVAVGSSILAWMQHLELARLRIALNATGPGELEERSSEAARRIRELEEQVATLTRREGDMPTDDSANRRTGELARAGRGSRAGPAAMRTLMDNPHIQALRSIQQRSESDVRYGALFKNLNLPADQVEKFKTLLSDRQATVMDVMAAAREQGINPRESPDEFRKLVNAAQAEIDNDIKALLGETGFAEYQTYEQTAPQRNIVSQLEQKLSYTAAPLTAPQSDQLVKILATDRALTGGTATSAGIRPGGAETEFGGMSGRGPGGGGVSVTITTAAITQAQSVLSPIQLTAFQQLQQQQQAQQQLQQAMRNTIVPPASGTPAPNPRRGGG